jgi:hypothetical protein
MSAPAKISSGSSRRLRSPSATSNSPGNERSAELLSDPARVIGLALRQLKKTRIEIDRLEPAMTAVLRHALRGNAAAKLVLIHALRRRLALSNNRPPVPRLSGGSGAPTHERPQ